MEKILLNVKECLLHFNYPLSNSMTEQELGDVFHTSNRCFLVSWMLKLADDAFKDIVDLEENKKNKEALGNLIHELGFCSKKEQLPFMNGDLDVNKQLTILYKMFKYIKLVKQSSPPENILPVSNEEIALLTTKNVNLFPMYGDIKTSKSVEIYTNETRLLEDTSASENDSSVVSDVHDNIEILIEGLRKYLPKLEVAAQNLPKDNKAKFNEKIVFHPSCTETLNQCHEYIKEVNQFVKDINTIEEFIKYEPTSDKVKACSSESKEKLNILWEEIFVTLRYQIISNEETVYPRNRLIIS